MKRIIETTIPLSPQLTNEFCKANNTNTNDIIFDFDVSQTSLTPEHVFGYLSNLKIDFRVSCFDNKFFMEYLKTPFLLGMSNLVHIHAEMLLYRALGDVLMEDHGIPLRMAPIGLYESIPEEVIEQQLEVITSLPTFLIQSANVPDDRKELVFNSQGVTVKTSDREFEYVGVNFAHLFVFRELLMKLCSLTFMNLKEQTYYTKYFDEYRYGGDALIKFANDNKSNLLLTGVDTMYENYAPRY